MTDDLYERYKEALRAGHVAVLRGLFEDATGAYRTAALIAPSRALPHTSLGGVLLRLGNLEEALAEYAAAVTRSPHDEAALLGHAEALTMVGQRVEAAGALDHVSEIQEVAGRLPEAADTLRRALELQDTAERSQRLRGLLREIRLSEGDQAAEQLLGRALRLRDEPTVGAMTGARSAGAVAPVGGPLDPAVPVVLPRPYAEATEVVGSPVGALDDASGIFEEAAPPASVSSAGTTPSPGPLLETAVLMSVVSDGAPVVGPVGESQQQPTGDELLMAAEAADISGDVPTLRSLLLWAARAYAREGRFEAGLDATHRLLQRSPVDVDAHLVLVEIYVARDWTTLAVEKLALLGRLADLNEDGETRRRICAVAGRAFPGEERLTAFCA